MPCLRRAVALPALLAAAAGCAGSDPGDAVRRDSAGVAIVENRAPPRARGGAWHLDTAAVVPLGLPADGSGAVAALPRGAFAAADDRGRVTWLDRRGRATRTAELPGAPAVAALFATAGGGLVAWDAERLAAVEIGEDGRPGAARSYEAAFPHASVAPLGALADGSLLVSARAGRAIFQIAPGPTRDTVPLFRLGPAGAHARILSIPGPEEVTWEAAGGGAVRVSTPFAREVFAAASGDRVWVADGLRAELRGYDAAGRLRQVVRGPLRGDPVGAADAARWRERMRRLAHGRLAGEELRRLQASLVVPDSWPPFAGLLAGPGGELWARAGGAPGSPARWNVFDAAGRWRGEVRVPARFELAAAGDGYVIATEHRAEAEDRSVLVPLMR